MRTIVLIVFISFTGGLFSQEQTAAQLAREARNDLREGNKKFHQLQFDEAEIAYKKALSKNPAYSKAAYNLGNAVYEQGRNKEAIAQFEWLEKTLTDKVAKADVFHNKGNAFIKEKQYGPAVEAYKNALRNRPEDEETRYNLAMAQELLEDQQSQNKDQQNSQDNKDNKDQQQDQGGGNDQDQKDKSSQDPKDGDKDPKDPGESPKDKGKDPQPPKPRPDQLSPEQMKQLLEAMNNEEHKTQQKLNAEKAKGKKTKRKKDW
ncbi:MAG: tetratricopeptide repeat protein [Lutibacter sp.]|jgi:tetratricopeptide (TPR) repeat protein|nr:tetratricopeptide repeat protein [Lutibacter sp.]